jgi:hypothetical protein
MAHTELFGDISRPLLIAKKENLTWRSQPHPTANGVALDNGDMPSEGLGKGKDAEHHQHSLV